MPKLKYNFWDYRLIKGLYNYESYEVDGYPAHIQESPDVTFIAEKKVIRSAAAVERRQRAYEKSLKDKDPEPGIRFYPKLVLAKGARFPSRKEWIERKKRELSGDELEIKNESQREARDQNEDRAKDMLANLGEDVLADLGKEFGVTLG